PIDFDLGDLPTDEELDAASLDSEQLALGDGGDGAAEPTLLGLFQLWFVLVALSYVLIGWGVGAIFAFRGAAQVGLAALTPPACYLIVFFWPVALWQLFFQQL